MFTYLLKIGQALPLSLHDGRHPTEGGLLEQLAPVEGVPVFEEADVVLGNIVDQVPGERGNMRIVCAFIVIN